MIILISTPLVAGIAGVSHHTWLSKVSLMLHAGTTSLTFPVLGNSEFTRPSSIFMCLHLHSGWVGDFLALDGQTGAVIFHGL
jgi:hypothetical protein